MKLARILVSALALTASFAATQVATVQIAFAQPKEKHEEVNVSVGETRTLAAPSVDRFSNAAPDIADIRPDPQNGANFLITGKKQGTTTLLLIKRDGSQQTYDIVVSTRPVGVVERELQSLLDGVTGVRMRRIGARIFIEGGVSTEADLKRVQQIAQIYQGQVESLVVIGGGGPERKLLLRLDFFFVQYEKTSGYAVGVGWPSQIGGNNVIQSNVTFDLIGKTTTSAQAQVVNQPLPRLDIAANNGWAKVMKQSTVITGNGSQASFNTGGEQNFLQNIGLTVGLVQVKFGTDVTVLPRYDSNTRDVEIKLTADVADLVPPAVGTVPGRTTTKLDTMVTLKLGQALVLSGIRVQTARRNIQGLPFISEIPVLGPLFGSHSRQDDDLEGAIFVIPSVVDSVPKSSLELIKNAMSTYKEFSGDIKAVDAYQAQPPSAK